VTRGRARSAAAAPPRRRKLTGTESQPLPRRTVELATQTQRRRRATAGTDLARVRALAADPHVFEIAALVAEGTQRDHAVGGRPRMYPDWCLVLFGACIRVFGSASATARALADPTIWSEVRSAAATVIGAEEVTALPVVGPNRDHWSYFLGRRLSEDVLEQLVARQRDLAVRRAQEIGLLNDTEAVPAGKYRRDHVVGLDGKVFSSPLRSLESERVNKTTGELHPVRLDTARQRYGEGGVEGLVWGTKFAIASIRSRLANHRVILGIAHFDATTQGGEGRVFTSLALDLAQRSGGIHGFTADGAWRGTHLNEIQTTTGCGVIAPARRRTARKGGILIDGRGFAAQPLPWSPRRAQREAACGGHQLWATAGTIFEQTMNVDGGNEYRELTRHQTKRDSTRHKGGTIRHQFYGRYSLPCPGHPDHVWWEPLLTTNADTKAGFNRTEYLRVASATSPEHRRLYGMRQDTESLNAQLERAFYGQRLPAWGVHNQTAVVLLATVADNAWALKVWRDEAEHQQHHPPAA
jgi:hypothetical protein